MVYNYAIDIIVDITVENHINHNLCVCVCGLLTGQRGCVSSKLLTFCLMAGSAVPLKTDRSVVDFVYYSNINI